MPKPKGTTVQPGAGGGANWWPPSFDSELIHFYVPVFESASIFYSSDQSFRRGEMYLGGSTAFVPDFPQYTVLRAIDPVANQRLWEFRGASERQSLRTGGTFATETGIVFWGDSRFLTAIDGTSGNMLWRANVGGQIVSAPMTYSVSGSQYVAVSAGRSLFVFSL
jgi:glucose dehydrogenase